MLAYVLALVIGLGSLGLYLAAFLFPEVHRKYDLVWSGVGLFYGLVLWVCAGRISGALLLGQIASVALLGWLGWQTLSLRLAQTPVALRTQMPGSATTAPEVARLTIQQLRANLQQGADRSSLVEWLDQGISRLEQGWLEVSSWVRAWSDTTSRDRDKPGAEPSAEWSDLEPDAFPDLDTIDAPDEPDAPDAPAHVPEPPLPPPKPPRP
jgi:predicted membrane metal-binding protein